MASFITPADTQNTISENLKGIKAIDFTLQELATLDFWLKALKLLPPGDNPVADDILFRGLMVEHFKSLLSEDTRSISAEESRIQRELEQQFLQSLSQILEQ